METMSQIQLVEIRPPTPKYLVPLYVLMAPQLHSLEYKWPLQSIVIALVWFTVIKLVIPLSMGSNFSLS